MGLINIFTDTYIKTSNLLRSNSSHFIKKARIIAKLELKAETKAVRLKLKAKARKS